MPGCLDAKDWNGSGEVMEVTAFWGEGIGTNSNTLKLQELGGFVSGRNPGNTLFRQKSRKRIGLRTTSNISGAA